jgi:uncharacterized protein YdaU (DUF1376 family)
MGVSMKKCFYFPFFPDEWLGSPKIMLMTPAEEGAYIRLLAIAWGNDNCALPNDDIQLASLSRLNEDWFKGSGDKIRQNFVRNGDTIYNSKLKILKKNLKKIISAKKIAGKAGAKKRWENNQVHGTAIADPKQNDGRPIAYKVKLNKIKEIHIAKGNGKFPQEWYQQLEQEYIAITNRKPVGSGWGKIRATFKQLFEEGYQVSDISGCMKFCQKKYTDWYMPALINHISAYKASGRSSALETLKEEAKKTKKEVVNHETEF